jgi:hypothetical protein
MNQQPAPQAQPASVQQSLDDIRKRLGRIEMHLIAIRGPRQRPKEQ